MPVFKKHHKTNYTCVSNELLRDTNLSNQSIGLMCKMLSLPEDWDFSIQGLTAISKDGETRITSSLNELKENGYLSITPLREEGKIIDWQYDVYESPQRQLLNRTVTNIGSSSTNIIDSFDIVKPQVKQEIPKEKSAYAKKKELCDSIEVSILEYLNSKTNSSFRPCKTNNALIRKLVNDNFTLEDMKQVVDFKCSEWLNNTEMDQYLRPSTLFGDKFDDYLSNAKKKKVTQQPIQQQTKPQIYSGKIYD